MFLRGVGTIRWVAAIVVAHFTAAVSLGERKLVDYFTWSWLQEVLTFSLMPPLLIFAGLVFRSVRAQPSNVLGHLGETLRENRERFLYGFLFILIVHRAYRALKVAIPRHNEYWADPMFASWDKAIFGQDPWLITHSMVGPLGTQFIDMLYVVWLPVMLISFGFAAFAKDSHFRKRATLSFFLTWILLGNLLATLFASVGPCFYAEFYGSDRFTPLMDLLSHQNLAALKLQETLRMTVGDEAIGSGISAVPSLHCAITMIVVLMVHDRYGWDWRTYLAIAYHVIIWFGSVHLGWHYAVDGMISTALIPFIWWASGKIVTLSERLPKKQPAPAVA